MSPKVSDEHRQIRRKEILDAARTVFTRKGYEPATMKDVVEESEMSRGGVYMYFSSTEEMMLALIEEEDQENAGNLQAAIEACGTVWEAVVLLLRSGERDMDQMSSGFAAAIYEFYLTHWRSHTYVSLLAERYDRAIGSMSAFLQKGVDTGEFQPIIPIQNIVHVMISMTDGMMMDSTYLGSERIRLHEQIESSIAMLHTILQVKTPIN